MLKHFRFAIVFVLALFLSGLAQEQPKNVILFIGDGMGPAQVTSLMTVKENPAFKRFKTGGMVTTYSADEYVTDSAAGATAFSTGVKSYNGAIAVDVDKKPHKTVLEFARDKGLSTGLVATCGITHATPAAFAAHVEQRKMYAEIAEDMAGAGVDVIIGGDRGWFIPKEQENSLREDSKDLLAQMRKSYTVIEDSTKFASTTADEKLLYFYHDKHPGHAGQRPHTLAEMTNKALEVLARNEQGFFLMVEGSQIDWGGHANETDYIIGEMLDFDEAVGAGLDFAEKDGNTLVIVTADHETGGMTLLGGSVEDNTVSKTEYTTKGHSGVMVPIFTYGPQAAALSGVIDNTDIGIWLVNWAQK